MKTLEEIAYDAGRHALASLVAGLVVAATLLGPWKLTFAMDARNLYAQSV